MAEEKDELTTEGRDAVKERTRNKKPPGYRKFEMLLKRVIKAPPIHTK